MSHQWNNPQRWQVAQILPLSSFPFYIHSQLFMFNIILLCRWRTEIQEAKCWDPPVISYYIDPILCSWQVGRQKDSLRGKRALTDRNCRGGGPRYEEGMRGAQEEVTHSSSRTQLEEDNQKAQNASGTTFLKLLNSTELIWNPQIHACHSHSKYCVTSTFCLQSICPLEPGQVTGQCESVLIEASYGSRLDLLTSTFFHRLLPRFQGGWSGTGLPLGQSQHNLLLVIDLIQQTPCGTASRDQCMYSRITFIKHALNSARTNRIYFY